MAAITSRRSFLAALAALPAIAAARAQSYSGGLPIRAVAFDALVLFDLSHVGRLAEELFPGTGANLFREWRKRQFEYAWLRTITRNYVDFWQITKDSLIAAGQETVGGLQPEHRKMLLDAYLDLRPWPDVSESLSALNESGLRLAILSNFTEWMLRRSELSSFFEHVLSTELSRTYKPDAAAYQLAVDAFGVSRPAILFAAFASWDAAGAKAFGFPTIWVNRSHAQWDPLGEPADHSTDNLAGLIAFVREPG
jgi:2-haloacid dehalogenase